MTRVEDGKIKTQIYASDSPYDRQKTRIGTVTTAMFESGADAEHLEKLEMMVREWVEFVQEDLDTSRDFHTFNLKK